MAQIQTNESLLQQIRQLQARLEELEETLRAIRSGEVDALVISRPEGEQVYTLKDALEPYRIMVEVMSEGAVTLTQNGAILYCNARFAELVKTPQEQIIGQPLHHWIAAQDGDKFDAMLARVKKEIVRDELVLKAGDGTWLPTYFSMSPLTESSGKEIAAVITDLTAVMAAAEIRVRQRESEDKFKYVFDHSPIGKSITSPDGKMQVNKAFCEMLGYSEEELQHHSWQDITHPDDIEETKRASDSLLSGAQKSARFIKRYLHKNGAVVWADVSTSLRRDEAGNPLYFMTSMLNITERKQAEDEIRKLNADLEQRVKERTVNLDAANKELEAFAYSVSHDLRVPLRAIDGFSRKLVMTYGDKLDDDGRRLLLVVRDNAQRMGQLIDDLLGFSRMGRREIERQPLDMNDMVRGIADELRAAEPQRTIEISLSPLPHASGDAAMLRQVWVNLLSNAIKFTRRRQIAHIEVGGRTEGGDAIYWVKDNGAGFDMQYADKLFGVFQRMHRQDEFEGTGVGLAIAQRILHRHNGRIWGEGKPDAGATFWFALPLVASDDLRIEEKAS